MRVIAPMALALSAGCASAPPKERELTAIEKIQREQAVVANMERQLGNYLRVKEDKEVLVYLRELAAKVASSDPGLSSTALGVVLVEDRGKRWRNYSIPGNRLYLSSGLVKHLDYENQLAAAIALELSHLARGYVAERLKQAKGTDRTDDPTNYPSVEGLVPSAKREIDAMTLDFFSPTGVFAYPDEYFIGACDTAVQLLYKAGFDSRGLISIWEIYRDKPEHSPHGKELLTKLIARTRQVIALNSPLRNPIVRSQAFLTIRKRMQKL